MFHLGSGARARARRVEAKREAESRQAALFAYGRFIISRDASLKYAMVDQQSDPADTVIRTGSTEQNLRYEPVQLKEIVPALVNPQQTLQQLLESIRKKYGSTANLTVAINLNRDLITPLGTIADPRLEGMAFWLFGIAGKNRGFIVRNPFTAFEVCEFDIPRLPPSLTEWI